MHVLKLMAIIREQRGNWFQQFIYKKYEDTLEHLRITIIVMAQKKDKVQVKS